MARISSQQEFDDLVAELEQQARYNPKSYGRKVFWLAMLGQMYFWGMIAVAIGVLLVVIALMVFVNILWAKLLFVVLPVVWMVLRVLWLKFEPPEDGLELEPTDAPALFAIIHNLEKKLNTQTFHHVHITDEFNASVVQMPKGLFGGTTNYLLIGLPLMQALSVEQFTAVLAHEFGHLSKSHARFSNWIYRQRMRFMRIMAAFEDSRSQGDFLLRPFLNWYIPYFSAYSFPLARANEYEADKIAGEITSNTAIAQALANIHVIASYREEQYWQSVFRHTRTSPTPAVKPYRQFASQFVQDITTQQQHDWLVTALAHRTDTADTHPSLTDRLSALQLSAQTALPQAGMSAETLLGADCYEAVVSYFDDEWKKSVAKHWQENYQQYQEDKKTLTVLQQRIKAGEALTADEQLERLQLAEILEVINTDSLIKHLTALQKSYSNHAKINFVLGRVLIDNQQETGVMYLQTAMRLDESCSRYASEILRDYYWQKGDKYTADSWHAKLEYYQHKLYENYVQNNRINLDDDFVTHDLTEPQYEKLYHGIRTVPQVKQASIVKRLGDRNNRETHVLCFKVIGQYETYSQNKIDIAYDKLQTVVDKVGGDILLINLDEDTENLFFKKFKKIHQSKLL